MDREVTLVLGVVDLFCSLKQHTYDLYNKFVGLKV